MFSSVFPKIIAGAFLIIVGCSLFGLLMSSDSDSSDDDDDYYDGD